jgi:hypothetical protein
MQNFKGPIFENIRSNNGGNIGGQQRGPLLLFHVKSIIIYIGVYSTILNILRSENLT